MSTDTTPAPIGADALRVAAQAALTTLENLHEIDTETECITIDVRDEIDALRAALARAAQPPITYAPPSPTLGVAPSGPGTSAASPKAAPLPAVQQVEPIGYLAAYEIDRLKQGHDGRLRSPKFGPSPLDSDVPVYLGPLPTAGVLASAAQPAAVPRCGVGLNELLAVFAARRRNQCNPRR